MEIDIEKIVEKRVTEFIDNEIKSMFCQYTINSARSIINMVCEKLTNKYVSENYEKLIQSFDEKQIAEYVRQRAILMAAGKMDKGE